MICSAVVFLDCGVNKLDRDLILLRQKQNIMTSYFIIKTCIALLVVQVCQPHLEELLSHGPLCHEAAGA